MRKISTATVSGRPGRLPSGRGPERENLEKLSNKLGLSDRITFLGFVEDQKQVELYANSMAVFYAPYDEDFGYVTVEAFKSQKPVITATDSGGPLEFVDDGVNGYICDSTNHRQMAERIDHLYSHRDLCPEMGAAGLMKVEDISWDNVVAQLTEGL